MSEPEFEPQIASLFKQAHGSKIALDLKEIILLDSSSTMDLFCNKDLLSKIFKSSGSMRLKSNGGSMSIDHKAIVPGYNKEVWFSTRAITNYHCFKQFDPAVPSDIRQQGFDVHRSPDA